MSRPPDYMNKISEALSEVMDDIGVNEILVMKRRRTWLLRETIMSIPPKQSGKTKCYYFGSQSEGSTTGGLESDIDMVYCSSHANVIQSMYGWKFGFHNFMIIQNENISPGYIYLQEIRPDLPLPATVSFGCSSSFGVTDSKGRLLRKNTYIFSSWKDLPEKHGPALRGPDVPGFTSYDVVGCLFLDSLPHQATSWLQRQDKWPTEDVLEECRNAGCFIVPVGSKVHSPDTLEGELEWRISTSFQERCIMFSLNIPQIRCYILMKMILKTHINPHFEDVLTSFMCKNVLMYCVANSSQDWHTGNLLAYLHLYLFMLKECVKQRNCPHFIIPENNLLAGRMTDKQGVKLLEIIDNLMNNDEELLYKIEIDDLGRRLKMKLNTTTDCPNILTATEISLWLSNISVVLLSTALSACFTQVLHEIKYTTLEMAHHFLSETISMHRIFDNAKFFQNTDMDLLHTACDLVIPMVSSTLGSVLACTHIDTHTPVSYDAFTYLEAGKASDTLSGRLKLISVLYCTGDMERVVYELTIIQTQINISGIHAVCDVLSKPKENINLLGRDTFKYSNKNAIKSNVAFCTRFLHCEFNCVPPELQYELLRSYMEEDRQKRTVQDSLTMDLISVDSIPYLYFLQYKTYGHLQRRYEQQQAFNNLALSTDTNLNHTETALNLLGQCCEQENMQSEALECYTDSLKHCKTNNAARFLLCIQLSKLWKQNNRE